MALDANAATVTSSTASVVTTHRARAAETDWTASQLATTVLRSLEGVNPKFITQSPLPLDVLGGMGHFVGALTLSLPLAEHVCVAVQSRDDQSMSVSRVGHAGHPATDVVTVALDCLVNGDGVIETDAITCVTSEIQGDEVICVVGALVECVRQGLLPVTALSATIGFGLTGGISDDVDFEAALMCGAVVSIAKALNVELDAAALHTAFLAVQSNWVCRAIGLGGLGAILSGEAHALSQVRFNPYAHVGSFPFPDDIAIVGIDTGVRHDRSHEKYTRARVATQMGRELVGRIVEHDRLTDMRWDGLLSQLTINDYTDRFRNRLPAQIKGSDYLARFGPINDPLAVVEPSAMYKVRSRTEHHIYEHARSGQFIEALARAVRTKTTAPLVEAGDLMYASHWSYGQRSGLGAIETDVLVNILRQYGSNCEIYGAKVSGQGCGGIIVSLMRQTEQSRAALDSALADYRQQTSLTPTLLCGSLPGALVSGACRA